MDYQFTTLDSGEFEHKAAAGTVSVDADKGIVECFVAAIGNKDSVGDIIVPGAFSDSLNRRKPRVVWGHDWNKPIGKVLMMKEVGPDDPTLPPKMRANGVGGLYAKVQFNMNSEAGREAFANVKFYGEEQEWSIGYKTVKSDYDPVKQANILRQVELFEVSPVLHGANQLTGTVSVKVDEQMKCEEDVCSSELSYSTTDPTISYDGTVLHMKPEGEADEKLLMVDKNRMVLERAFSQAFQRPARLRHMDDRIAIFITPDNVALGVPYRMDGHNPESGALRVVFGNPKPMRARFVYEPMTDAKEPDMEPDHDCQCGEHLPKSDDADTENKNIEEVEEKAGRVLSTTNLNKLRQALELLQAVVSSQRMPEEEVSEEGMERKVPSGKKYHEAATAASSKTLVMGKPHALSGAVITKSVKSLDEAVDVVQRLHDQNFSSDAIAIVAPTVKAFEDGDAKVSVWLPGNVPGILDTKVVGTNVIDALGTDGLSVEKKAFYGVENKSFEEVFIVS